MFGNYVDINKKVSISMVSNLPIIYDSVVGTISVK